MRLPAFVLLAAVLGPGHEFQPVIRDLVTITTILDRMGEYLVGYEAQLSSIVADEVFDQKVFHRRTTTNRRLDAEVTFMRLPGDAGWLGFRDVRRVNHQPLKDSSRRSIADLLTSGAGDIAKATAIAQASSAHNLGLPRTINVPTAPLELVHPRNRQAFSHRFLGRGKVRGTETVIVGFHEVARPTVTQEPGGGNLVSDGRIWVEENTGTVWRIEWFYRPEKEELPPNQVPRLRVEYARHKELGMMVPIEMSEVFTAPPRHGEGKASYKNFRRFQTSARIVPQ